MASDWGSFEECRTCGEYDWANRHRCKPVHHCRLAERDEEWFTVHAVDARRAAERAAEKVDQDFEGRIAYEGRSITIEVADDPAGNAIPFFVEGYLEAKYRAREGAARG